MLSRLVAFTLILTAQSLGATIVNGPMLGPIEMREAKIWVQVDEPSIVRIAYQIVDTANGPTWSLPVETDTENGNTATVRLTDVEPGRTYSYRVEVNGEIISQTSTFRTPTYYHGRTPPPNFTIAVGGAHYAIEDGYEPPYQILGASYNIFETIAKKKPAFMLWLGHTAHLRESDWGSKSGYIERFTNARSRSELKNLLSVTPQYATWGGADYGSPGAGASYSHRENAESSFLAFWPQPVKVKSLQGIATRFRYADADFFLLDTRSYRNNTPTSDENVQILGPEQIEWLRQELVHSTATFKVICAGAPILNPAKNLENLSYADHEHTAFLQMLRTERISGLFFLSGGKYHGEMTRLVHANSYNIHDLTLGPLTANPKENKEELNYFRMPGSSTFERHFALIDFVGSEEDRSIRIRVMDVVGKELWTRSISARELQMTE